MIGIILRNMRKMKGLTQFYIGKKLNLAENTISNYETEYSNPNFDTIYKFITFCDFDIEFIDKESQRHYTIQEISQEMDF